MRSRLPTALSGLGGVVEEVEPDEVVPEAGETVPSGGLFRQFTEVFVENRLAVIGLGFIVFAVVFCFLGPVFYHTNQTSTQDALLFSTQNAPPSRHHLLGTDSSG